MLDVLRWYVVVELVGLAGLPFAARFLGDLPDRGYAFARPLGLLILGVLLWFGATFGFWPNTGAMIAVLLVAIALAGWLGLRRSVVQIRELWKNHRSHVYVVEAVFLGAFLLWAFCRAFFPEIAATEKPMDFMFLNGILRSQQFPPVDPWLSGYSISYYYLGYLLVAVLTALSGVIPAVAFNLAIATLFALTVTGAFAITHALVDGLRRTRAASNGDSPGELTRWPSWLAGGLGAVFVALLGNWEGFLELLHAHGFGSASFWQSLAIWNLNHPYLSATWYPNDAQDNWWWFRASRVILDYPFGAAPPKDYNTINEFPFFSFLLGDMHPHLMALPFAFLCLGFALSFLRSSRPIQLDRVATWGWDLVFVWFLFGSLFLLNAWDILTYLFVFICAFAVRSYLSRPAFDLEWIRRSVVLGMVALGGSLLLYWPFYLTFRSQASGLLGIVTMHSHLRQFAIFWGLFLLLAGSLVLAELVFGISPIPQAAIREAGPAWTRNKLTWVAVAVVAVLCYVAHAPALTLVVPLLVGSLALALRYLGGCAVPGAASLIRGDSSTSEPRKRSVARRDGQPAEVAGGAVPASWATEHTFVFVLLFVAMLLIASTELVYIQDLFNNRMNTVFKFYYQAWELLALVGAYTVFYLGSGAFAMQRRSAAAGPSSMGSKRTSEMTNRASRPGAVEKKLSLPRFTSSMWLAVVGLAVAAAFVYVPASLESRSQGFSTVPTLDGLAYYAKYQPDDAAAIAWLNGHVSGTPTIVEATGGSYSANGEVAWMTGLPTLLGWNFHEVQWRGPTINAVESQRKADLDTIYRTTDRNQTLSLLEKYDATYVYVGPLEREAYPNDAAGLSKFGSFMDVVYRNPGVTIYKVRGAS